MGRPSGLTTGGLVLGACWRPRHGHLTANLNPLVQGDSMAGDQLRLVVASNAMDTSGVALNEAAGAAGG